MLSKRMILSGLAVALLGVAGVSQLYSQPGGGRGPGGPGGMMGRFDPAQMQQRMMEGLKDRLGASDDEWKIIEPRLTKVMETQRSQMANRGGMMMRNMFRNRNNNDQGNRPGRANRPERPDRPRMFGGGEETEIQKQVRISTEALNEALDKADASADDIKKLLSAVRTAREKARQELDKARKDLRQVLSLRQEAMLVLMGTLE